MSSPLLRAAVALGLLAAAACGPSRPAEMNGPEGAALNVGLGVAVAPLHRAATGCYTPCAYGTVCDEANGVCVAQEGAPPSPPASAAPADPGVRPTAPGAPAGSASGAPPTPVCTPACMAGELCVTEVGKAVCKQPQSSSPLTR